MTDDAADEDVMTPEQLAGDVAAATTALAAAISELPPPEPALDALPDLLPLALGSPRKVVTGTSSSTAAPYADAREHLAAVLDVVAARATLSIAEAWHTGRISAPGGD